MTVAERDELLEAAVPVEPSDPASRRFAVRRGEAGLEIFDAKCTQEVDGEAEFHGHPAGGVPPKVLREFRDSGQITKAEYSRLIRRFGCP